MDVKRQIVHTLFWECHEIQTYWKKVHAIIKDILGYVIPKECKVIYLGSINDYVTGNDRYLTKILLITCKKAVTRAWHKTDPPTAEQSLHIFTEI